MNPPLAALRVLEVLHHVGDVRVVAGDSDRLEPVVEQTSGGSDERPPCEVLGMPGLLADQHHARGGATFSKHGVRRALVERAAVTRRDSRAQRRQRMLDREKRLGAWDLL